ncbi:autotransporter domain-containing protein [Fusobacterium perfoetens]|uniref:autotransporter domain-containing protein n=1 Tax=Fusobacterium perfoetens TaxID=852 RepID=UPI001F30CB93|nr:autotransporter domain-containing protein [Fusobacterium perfoetens]MCF2626285.1 autotransporter domain-containing protein [Fusobacterium perfoetens]
MGRNYAENSLKKFLKRKVKITMGVVVSFLITGAVAFGAEPQEPTINADGAYIPYNKWTQGIGKTEEILKDDIIWNGQEILKADDVNNLSKYMGEETKKIIKSSSLLWKNSVNAGNSGNNYTISGELFGDNGNYSAGLSYTGDNIIKAGETRSEFSLERVFVNKTEIYYAAQVARDNETAVNKGIITGGKPSGFTEPTDGTAYGIGQYAEGVNAKVYNYGVISTSNNNGQRAREGGEAYNYGIIIGNISQGQNIVDSFGYNYGIIANNGQRGQAANGIESFVYNYGVIANNNHIGQYGNNLINYGIIKNNGNDGQYGNLNDTKIYNYGTIANKGELGQYIDFGTHNNYGEAYNYGIIANEGKKGQAFISNKNQGKIYNYGIIANKGDKGQELGDNAGGAISDGVKSYNYGIIANTGGLGIFTDDAGESFNYGIVANKGQYSVGGTGRIHNNGIVINNDDSFANIGDKGESKNVKNNGVVILKNTGTGFKEAYKQHNNGIEINAKDENNITISEIGKNMLVATNQSDNTVTADKKFTGGILAENTNLFVDRYTKGKLTETVTLDNKTLAGNHITTVVGKDDKTDKVVISTKDDLTLTDSSIVGYFEKDGTLLNVNGDLTLSGNSVINAIAGNEYTGYKGNALNNVVAVKLSDNGTLTIEENSKVLGAVKGNGTLVYENIDDEFYSNTQEVDSAVIKTTAGKTTDITLANLTLKDSGTGVNNAGKLIIDNQSDKELEGKEVSTTITLANNINIEKGIDGSSSKHGIELILGDGQTSSDNTISVDSITLGTESDILTINNALKEVGVIDGKDGDDIVNLKNLTGTHDTFDYQLKNIETLDLNNQTWKIGAKADISFDNGITKAGEKTTIQNGTLMGELKGTVETGVDFVNNEAVNKVIGNSTFGDNAKFQIGIGKDMELVAGGEYDIADTTVNNLKDNVGEKNITASAIFTKATEQGKDIRVKSTKEMNIDERYSGIYEEMLENASSNSEILNVLNSTDVSSIANAINEKGALGDTLATTGYKITRDISNSFMSAVNEWGKKANKGEWLANAKYINSDVEYDGANKVKGYDSDIKSMVGMIEYGVSDNTSLGIALGGGDTEIDVKDAGTLKGDNYYIGAYAKHSVNGFDLTGNLGYTISDLEVNGKGSADSSAITLGGYIKRDIALTETVRLEPNLSFTYDYIMQDNAEGNGVKVDNKDVHVFEAGAGMNIVKGFNFEKGVLELEAGVKYSMADVNRNEETVISVYGIDDINLGNPEVDKTRGTAHVGFDYEHETGFGVNGKYEMMWSDSGDDSRLTAGISYRF